MPSLMGLSALSDELSLIVGTMNLPVIISHSEFPPSTTIRDCRIVITPTHGNARRRYSVLLYKTWLRKSVGASDQNILALNSNITLFATMWAEEAELLAIWNTHSAVGKNNRDINLIFAVWTIHAVPKSAHFFILKPQTHIVLPLQGCQCLYLFTAIPRL